MTHSATMPRFGQAISGLILLAIAIAAGLTGLKINVFHGLELRPEAGILFGLADLTKIVLPIVCGMIGWTLQARAVAIVCVATSLFCAVNAFNGAADHKLTGQQHAAEQYAMVKADVGKIEARVASLDAQVAQEAKDKGCGNICKSFKEQASGARLELVAARTALATAAPVVVTGAEQISSRITSILFLVLIEALVWMSVPAMTLLGQAMTFRSTPKKGDIEIVAPAPKKIKKRKAKPVKKDWTQAAAYILPKKLDGRTKEARSLKKMVAANAN